jgi:hypothetical protein
MDYRYVDYTTVAPSLELPKVGSTYRSSFTKNEYNQTASESFATNRVIERTRNPQSNLNWGSTYNDTIFADYTTYTADAKASSTFDVENEYNDETFTGLTRFNYEKTGVGTGTSVFRMTSVTTNKEGGGYTIWGTAVETYKANRYDQVNDRSTFLSTYTATDADYRTVYFTRTYPIVNYFYDMWGGITSFSVRAGESTGLYITYDNTFKATRTKTERYGFPTSTRNKTYVSYSLASYDTVTIIKTRQVSSSTESNWLHGGTDGALGNQNPMPNSTISYFESMIPVSTTGEMETVGVRVSLDTNNCYKTEEVSGVIDAAEQAYENGVTSVLTTYMALTGKGKYYAYGTYQANHEDYWLQPPDQLKYTISNDEWVEVFAKRIIYNAYTNFKTVWIPNMDSSDTVSYDTVTLKKTCEDSNKQTLQYFSTFNSEQKHKIIRRLGGQGDTFIAETKYSNINLAESKNESIEFAPKGTCEYTASVADNTMYETLRGAQTYYEGSAFTTIGFNDACGLKGKMTAHAQLSLSNFDSMVGEPKGTTFRKEEWDEVGTSNTLSSVKSFVRKPQTDYMEEISDREIRKLWDMPRQKYVYMPWLQSVYVPYYLRGLYASEMKVKSTIPIMLDHKSMLLETGMGTYNKTFISMNNVHVNGAFLFSETATLDMPDRKVGDPAAITTNNIVRLTSLNELAVLRATSTYSVSADNVVNSEQRTSSLYFTTVNSPLITQHERVNIYPYGDVSTINIVSNQQHATKKKIDDEKYYETQNETALKQISVFTGRRIIEAVGFTAQPYETDTNFKDTVKTTIISHNMNSAVEAKSFVAEWGQLSAVYAPETSKDWKGSFVSKGGFSTTNKPIDIRKNRELYFQGPNKEYVTVVGHTNLFPELVTTTIIPMHSKMPYIEGNVYTMPFYTDDTLWGRNEDNQYVGRYIATPWNTKMLKDDKTMEVRPEMPVSTGTHDRPNYAMFRHYYPKKIFVDEYIYEDKNINYKVQGAFDFPSGTHAMPQLVKIPKEPQIEIL